MLGLPVLAAPALAQDTGGVAPGQPMLVAAPAMVGQQQQVTGSLGTSAGGRSVEIEAQATVTPSAMATVYRRATATWYSQPGNRTACGIKLRRSTIGVAHRTLPCGTLVDVTWGGRSLSVPVIDRGPFVAGVHYDLTLAAARTLGFVAAGRVRVGVLPAGATTAPSPIAAVLPGAPAQVGGGAAVAR